MASVSFYSLWFDLTGAQTHGLPHSRRARLPLHHQCGLDDRKVEKGEEKVVAIINHGFYV
jgi:hypothetical protein